MNPCSSKHFVAHNFVISKYPAKFKVIEIYIYVFLLEFYGLTLTFRTLINFELVFTEWSEVQLHFHMWQFSWFSTTCWRDCSLSLDGIGSFVENQLAICLWKFWIFNFISLIYIFILVSVPHYLDYHCFVVSFEIRQCIWFSRLFWLLQIWGLLQFHMNFRITLSISIMSFVGILMENVLNL